MGMTATQLGAIFGRGAAAMNLLLKEHGFLEGGPGAWRPTELGKQFAQSHDFDNGYGGFAHRSWGWLSWSDGLIDALKTSIEQNPDGIATAGPTSVVKAAAAATNGNAGQASGRNKWVVLAVLGAAAAVPTVKNAWNRRAQQKSHVDNASSVEGPPVDESVPDPSVTDGSAADAAAKPTQATD